MSDSRPNIIFIITDQQRFDTIRELGFGHMDTPNLDRLVREGVTFTNCYIPAASCAPCRASLFTGQYPHSHGVLRNGDRWRHSWVENLKRSGYNTINIGKMHTFPYNELFGFRQRYTVENKDRHLEGRYFFDEWDKALKARGLKKPGRLSYRSMPDYRERLGAFEWPIDEDMHPDTFVGETATWWLENYPRTEPLFLEIGFPGPHPPYDPPTRYSDPYMDKDLPLLDVTQEELDGQPEAYRGMIQHNCEVDHDSVVHQWNPSPEARHRQRAYYCGNVTLIDEQVGRIMETLGTSGYLDNSIVIFTSDHGDCLTDHGHSQKWTMYDTVTRMPLIVWSPKRFSGGRRLDGLCSLLDLGPTILEMAGLEPPRKMEAESLLRALQGEPWEGREQVFCESARDVNFTTNDFQTMIRTRDWKLVHFLDAEDGQLFDLANDPDEVRNLWNDHGSQSKKRELLDALLTWRIRSQYDHAGWEFEFLDSMG